MQVHILTIIAGHDFDAVKRKEAFSDKMIGEAWATAECEKLFKAAMVEDPTFEYGWNFYFSVGTYEVDQALETK